MNEMLRSEVRIWLVEWRERTALALAAMPGLKSILSPLPSQRQDAKMYHKEKTIKGQRALASSTYEKVDR